MSVDKPRDAGNDTMPIRRAGRLGSSPGTCLVCWDEGLSLVVAVINDGDKHSRRFDK